MEGLRMRLFIASSFETSFIEILEEITAYAYTNAGGSAVKWVERANFHLTYVFLGEVSESGAAAAIKSVDDALKGRKSFTLVSGAFGAFPSLRNPQVLWLGFKEGAPELREIAGKLARALSERGLTFDNRFEPHVTLGRIKKELPANLCGRMADYALTKTAVSRLASVEVMESSIICGCPVYKRVYSRQLL
ncbi:MAG TPA: RNA 2',3'-cyclic phosphodiesterase [Elusimicrobia bacterium]|nr:RNA 2',3'-cyclic phosphodiesterase [Elusimicrobiota bacterium]